MPSKVSYIFNVSGGGEQRNERRRREKCDAAASVIVVLQHREELYGKLLRAAAAVDLKSRLMGLKGRAREGRKKREDCFLLRNPIPILAEKMGQKREEGDWGVLKWEYEGRAEEERGTQLPDVAQ